MYCLVVVYVVHFIIKTRVANKRIPLYKGTQKECPPAFRIDTVLESYGFLNAGVAIYFLFRL